MFITKVSILTALALLTTATNASHAAWTIKSISGQAAPGTVQIQGVAAGDFNPSIWLANKVNLLPDSRRPLIEPGQGAFRNIYAPSAVELENGWRVFYGGWDGVDTGNDRIYSLNTPDFLDFSQRTTVIEHGVFQHVCNVNAIRLPDGSYRMLCTAFPDNNGRNKPAFFSSTDGLTWNGSPMPYPAHRDDMIAINGYDNYANADINGMNVILHEDGLYRLYFGDFNNLGKVFRATSTDGKLYKYDGVALETPNVGVPGAVNDMRKLSANGRTYYLMALHENGQRLWYSLSTDGVSFGPAMLLAENVGDADAYMVAIGWVTRGDRVLGFLYGAGQTGDLCANRIFARWLQKKVVFVANNGARCEPASALGPDSQVLTIPNDRPLKGHFEAYHEDGSRITLKRAPRTLRPGTVYTLTN